ncbi:MAG: quinoprotein glucose dehydrogenase [Limisphaerales bacterium]|jgi:quinoprotein glucose dehydrogenase
MSNVLRCFSLTTILALAACNPPATTPSGPWSDWSSYAGSPDSAQYSSLNQINRYNVAQLEVAWTYPTGDTPHRATPLVIDDVMYIVANQGVTAIEAATGKQIWFTPDVVSQHARGFSYWQDSGASDRRLLVVNEPYLVALDATTGQVIQTFGEAGKIDLRENLNREPETIGRVATMTPGRVFEDLIIMGSAVGDDTYAGAPGDIRAYNVRTGDLVWTFHTIPHPGEFGYDTWPADAWKTMGAANAWTNMALDEARGIVYVPTGAPSYHFYGANRIGDNLFSTSLIALKARTGERLWHFQAVKHDIWDYDLAMGPKLLTVSRDGQLIDAVALAGKHGYLYVFDRITGEALFNIEDQPVPSSDVPGEVAAATQPIPTELPAFARQSLSADNLSPYAEPEERLELAARINAARNEGLFTPPSFGGSVSAPGSRGGAQHGNGAVSPKEGLFYMAVINSPTIPVLEPRSEFSNAHYLTLDAKDIYLSSCASCHGVGGAGQPPLFPALNNLSERLSEVDLARVLKQGSGRMTAFPNIPESKISDLLSYVSTLDPNSTEPLDTSATDATTVSQLEPFRSGYHHFFSDNGLVGPPPWSKLMAWDLNTGDVLWEKPYGNVIALEARGITGTGSLFPTNSLSASAGGLLFSTTNDRKIRAWHSGTGEVLWSADLSADPGGIPAIFQVAGRQYVVATATRGDRDAYGRKGAYAYIAYALPIEQD